jgi:transitional endoplasmic reticulum ATPase
MTLAGDVDVDWLAAATEGCVGADLASICDMAGYAAIREVVSGAEKREGEAIVVALRHFKEALGAYRERTSASTDPGSALRQDG